MGRPAREGPKKKEVLIRIDPDEHNLLRAVSVAADSSIQALLEPVLLRWLADWQDNEAVQKVLEAQAMLRTQRPD
jgi:hypothetical protein